MHQARQRGRGQGDQRPNPEPGQHRQRRTGGAERDHAPVAKRGVHLPGRRWAAKPYGLQGGEGHLTQPLTLQRRELLGELLEPIRDPACVPLGPGGERVPQEVCKVALQVARGSPGELLGQRITEALAQPLQPVVEPLSLAACRGLQPTAQLLAGLGALGPALGGAGPEAAQLSGFEHQRGVDQVELSSHGL